MFFYNQRKNQEKNRKNIVFGALFASFITGVLALLFTPKSGKDLRSDIATGAKSASVKAQKYAEEAGKAIQGNTKELQNRAAKIRENLAHTFDDKKEKITEKGIRLEVITEEDVEKAKK